MDLVDYLLFVLKCLDLFAWPLVSLGYPLCASICSIENNSNSGTRKLITYWVLYSLISLFEHAFMKLLEWLPFWPYMKLIIICGLVIPHFNGALYFYELLVRPCLSLEPHDLFNEWKEHCLKRDDILAEAKRYKKHNDSEALEKLLPSESNLIDLNVGPKEIKAVEVTEKNEVAAIETSNFIEHNVGQKEIKNVEETEKTGVAAIETSNFIEHNVEQKEIKYVEVTEKTVEVTEKTEVTAIKMVSDSIESTLAQTGKSTETVTDMNERATRRIPDSKEVQKEWTCAICQVTTQSEITLNSHLRGNRHKANYEELKANNLRAKNKGFPASTAKKVVQNSESPPFWCGICNAKCPRKFNYHAHLKGKRHLARIRELAGLVGGQHD